MNRQARQWPAPYLQPNPKEDCAFYATAYICHCLGYPSVTAEAIKAWREETHYYEGMYPLRALGCSMERYADHERHSQEMTRFWLGTETRAWVESHLMRQEIALMLVHRIPELAHAIVLLEGRGDDGALVHDPIFGLIVEPWDWLLATGPGTHTAHHIEGWFTLPVCP